ncbi:MAG: mono/diheme cytochrome c family protein [Gammaproteobacteria bacterium]|jgi:mono/diheme cytochrome c family protein
MINNFKVGSCFSIGLLFCLVSFSNMVSAQGATLDYYGEINESEHPPGYQDYVEMGCFQCHGFQGQGANSPKLVAPVIPYDGFANQVRRPRNTMPAYSPNVLSEAKLRSIYSYLQNIPPSPDPSEIPLLSGD